MTIKVLFFAQLRDYAGVDSVDIEVGPEVDSDIGSERLLVRDLLGLMKNKLPDPLIDVLQDESALVSVNHQYAGWDGSLTDGDEVGLLPPVSGG